MPALDLPPTREGSTATRRRVAVICVIALSALCLIWVATEYTLYRQNNLFDNGNWCSRKIETFKDVLGIPFVTTRTALHRNRLNLAAWLGFQEVVYRTPVTAKQVKFDFFLPAGSYVVAIYNRSDSGFSGVRLSDHVKFPSIRFRATTNGRFVTKQPLEDVRIHRGRNCCQLDFNHNQCMLEINGRSVAVWDEPIANPQQVGFRGSLHDCYIDNVVITGANGEEFRETFRNTRNASTVAVRSTIGVLALSAIAAAVLFWGRSLVSPLNRTSSHLMRLAGHQLRRHQLTLVVGTCGLLWLLLLLLATHTSSQPSVLGRWSARLLAFILFSGAAVIVVTLITGQATKAKLFETSWIGRALDFVRRRTLLRIVLAAAPWVAAVLLARRMAMLSMVMTTRVKLAVLCVLLLLVCFELLLLTPIGKPRRRARRAGESSPLALLALLHVTFAACALAFFATDYWFVSLLYPPQSAIDSRGLTTFLELEEDVIRRVKHDITALDDDEFRILLLGTSQTWGAGVDRPGDEICDRLQRKLTSEVGQEMKLHCINAAVPGSDATRLLQNYQQHWLDLDPDLVLINLSFNDLDVEILINKLQTFIELGREHDIPTVLVLEPNSIEAPPEQQRAKHDRMRELAEQFDVPVVDMQNYLDRVHDEGFLWWDRVHLTSLGSALFAEHLADELMRRQLITTP